MTRFRGNLAEDFTIPKVEELSVYWVELKREIWDPGKRKLIKEQIIQCFNKGDWDRMQRQATGQGIPGGNPIDWVTVAGWHTFELLQDPTLPTKDPKKLEIK